MRTLPLRLCIPLSIATALVACGSTASGPANTGPAPDASPQDASHRDAVPTKEAGHSADGHATDSRADVEGRDAAQGRDSGHDAAQTVDAGSAPDSGSDAGAPIDASGGGGDAGAGCPTSVPSGTCSMAQQVCEYATAWCDCSYGNPPTNNLGWHCTTLAAGCPDPAPTVGQSCTSSGLTCDYGQCMGGHAYVCQGGAWAMGGIACPG